MLEALVGLAVTLLVLAGVLVILGPNVKVIYRRLVSSIRPTRIPSAFGDRRAPEVMAPALNPKTQRVLVAAARLANWMRAHDNDTLARELRNAAARMTGNEPSGLYALQGTLRKIRAIRLDDSSSQERLNALAAELHTAVQDRFEQLELLPFGRP